MAQEKDERTTPSARKAAEASEGKTAGPGRASPKPAVNGGAGPGTVARRRQQYLIAVRPLGPGLSGAPGLSGGQPQSIEAVVDYLSQQEDIEIVRRVKPAGVRPFESNGTFSQDIVVARIEEGKAETLRAAGQPQIIVERDAPLTFIDGAGAGSAVAGSIPSSFSAIGTEVVFRIVGDRDLPLPRAVIVVYGPGFPVQAVTDDSGTARIILFGGQADSVRAIYVKPAANHWERLIPAPELNHSGVTTIKLRSLAETFPGFPNERLVGWGQRLMRWEQAAGKLTGAGIRIGLIGSGCDNSHPALRRVTRGKDFTDRRNDNAWTDDAIAYGTHAAGVIAGVAASGQPIAGFAPEAELHAFKVFPGGHMSDLLAALDECIARELDVACIGVGCDESPELLHQKLQEVQHRGCACIVAAGNFGAPAQLAAPAGSRTVFAVGAVGKIREFPMDTWHAQAVIPQLIGRDGVFPAAFSGIGPQIAVSAPGVAVVSTVPGGYGALDGTLVAAAHVTGMAALILAHHPLFQGQLKVRSDQRVNALLGLIRASAVPYFADVLRGGAGVPDLQRVPGLDSIFGVRPFGTAAAAVAPDLFGNVLGGAPAVTGAEPFQGPFPAYGPVIAQGWQALIQMRAAGLL